MSVTIYGYPDGTLSLVDTPAQKAEAFAQGALPIVTVHSIQRADEVLAKYGRCIGGRWYLNAAMDRPMRVEEFVTISSQIRQEFANG
jgi:hypothetical protein